MPLIILPGTGQAPQRRMFQPQISTVLRARTLSWGKPSPASLVHGSGAPVVPALTLAPLRLRVLVHCFYIFNKNLLWALSCGFGKKGE